MISNQEEAMRKSLNVKKVLRGNPIMDSQLLVDSERLVKQLKKIGVLVQPQRRLAAPFSRKRVTATKVQ